MVIESPWGKLRELTDARIALGRAGHSLPTRDLLAFQLAHAKARHAVHRSLDIGRFLSREAILLKSAARDRAVYLRRPDLGRRLAAESASKIMRGDWDAALVIADGLSAGAVERFALPLINELGRELRAGLDGWRLAPLCVVEQARVAIGDQIGERLGAAMAVVLIGERPGLSAPESMGVYLTWSPRVGRSDAERNCVSNIRDGGLDPTPAARRVAALMHAARAQRLTGVGLKLGTLT